MRKRCKERIGQVALGAALMAGVVGAVEAPTIAVEEGKLRGVVEDDILVYRGIPYAAPPVGELRWRPAQKPEPWEGLREADAFGPACPQVAVTDEDRNELGDMDEGCLTLNVWTLEEREELVPVMFWIHGGGFRNGSVTESPALDAKTSRAQEDCVLTSHPSGRRQE